MARTEPLTVAPYAANAIGIAVAPASIAAIAASRLSRRDGEEQRRRVGPGRRAAPPQPAGCRAGPPSAASPMITRIGTISSRPGTCATAPNRSEVGPVLSSSRNQAATPAATSSQLPRQPRAAATGGAGHDVGERPRPHAAAATATTTSAASSAAPAASNDRGTASAVMTRRGPTARTSSSADHQPAAAPTTSAGHASASAFTPDGTGPTPCAASTVSSRRRRCTQNRAAAATTSSPTRDAGRGDRQHRRDEAGADQVGARHVVRQPHGRLQIQRRERVGPQFVAHPDQAVGERARGRHVHGGVGEREVGVLTDRDRGSGAASPVNVASSTSTSGAIGRLLNSWPGSPS